MTDHRPPRPSSELLNDSLKLSPKQRLVLDTLSEYPAGAKAAEIAGKLGMHVNTVRGHLDELIEQEAVQVLTSPAQGRGRPSLVFKVRVPDYSSIANEYITLIEVLADTLSDGKDKDELAVQIGRAWAEKMQLTPDDRAPIDRLQGILRDIGFDPEPAAEDEIALHSCPFIRSDGQAPAKFVCGIHAGMLRASVPENLQLTLTPLSGPAQCNIRLANAGE